VGGSGGSNTKPRGRNLVKSETGGSPKPQTQQASNTLQEACPGAKEGVLQGAGQRDG
jgi:hypothetical protein